MTTLSGTEFNEKYPNTEFYKILTRDYKHFDFTYKHGLNVDHIPFNPTGECSSGGLYFTELNHLAFWISNPVTSIYIAKVTIPSDANVYIGHNKFKADKFVLDLDNKVLIKDFYIWDSTLSRENEALCKLAVSQNGVALQYIKYQTDEICKLAVSNNSYALQDVINQTDELCKLAVTQNGYALEFVINQTDEICKLAVTQNGDALQYVINKTDEICELAVRQDGYALEYVINQTDEICKLAVSQNGYALKYVNVRNRTYELCKLAVSQNIAALKYVRDQPDKINMVYDIIIY